jgi:hypothetical protein
MDTKKLPARVLRDFNDAGTAVGNDMAVERRFKKDAEVQLTEGELENFRACGLVEAIAVEVAPATEPTPPAGQTEGEETKRSGRRG